MVKKFAMVMRDIEDISTETTLFGFVNMWCDVSCSSSVAPTMFIGFKVERDP